MNIEVPREEYRAIEDLIQSAESPVGIDAKKTHVLILHLLLRLDRRIQALEGTVDRLLSERP